MRNISFTNAVRMSTNTKIASQFWLAAYIGRLLVDFSGLRHILARTSYILARKMRHNARQSDNDKWYMPILLHCLSPMNCITGWRGCLKTNSYSHGSFRYSRQSGSTLHSKHELNQIIPNLIPRLQLKNNQLLCLLLIKIQYGAFI